MSLTLYWQLDVAADPQRGERGSRGLYPAIGRDVRDPRQGRFDYYAQIARAAAQTAFDGLFLPHCAEADDSQIVAAAIAREAPRLRLVPQFPTSVGSAVYAAKQAASFQRFSGDRLGWAIASDAAAGERARGADFVADDDLPLRTAEFLTVARGVFGERPYSLAGRHFEVQGGGFDHPLTRAAFPTVYLEGEDEAALDLSARLADVHLFRATALPSLRAAIETLDGLAAGQGRSVGFGLVQQLVARETAEDADRDARRLGSGAHAIVGDYDGVAAALAERVALGIEHLVLAAAPSLEEAYRIGQHVLPRLRAHRAAARAAA